MSDKLTAIKIKYPNGTYSEQILLSVLAENVQVNSNTTLSDALDLIDARIDQIVAPTGSTSALDAEIFDARIGVDGTDHGNLGDAIRNQINSTNNEIADLKSGNPLYLKYDKATTIPNNTDYNTLQNPGTYKCTSSSSAKTMTNAPNTGPHLLIVLTTTGNNRVYQIAFCYNTARPYIKARQYTGEWTDWSEMLTKKNIDNTLSIEGNPADAKATGDALALKSDISYVDNTISSETFALKQGKVATIPDNTDINTIITPGNYKCLTKASALTMPNVPTTAPFRLLVFTSTATQRVFQIAFCYNAKRNIIRIRNKVGDGTNDWSNEGIWETLTTEENISESLKNIELLNNYVSQLYSETGVNKDISALFTFTDGHRINYSNGKYESVGNHSASNYVDIRGVKSLKLTRIQRTAKFASGLAFYADNTEESFISGIVDPYNTNLTDNTVVTKLIVIPDGASFIRTTWLATDETGFDEFRCIVQYEGSDNAGLPDYYFANNYIDNRIQTILNNRKELGDNSVEFAFFTDPHFYNGETGAVQNGMNQVNLIKYIKDRTNISFAVCGGDLVNGNSMTNDQCKDLYVTIYKHLNPIWNYTYMIIGNHEWNNAANASSQIINELTFPQLYNQWIADKDSEFGSLETECGSYWIDNVVKKIRYFFLGTNKTGNITYRQLKWFASEMEKVPENYYVVVLSHISLTNDLQYIGRFGEIIKILEAVKNRSSYEYLFPGTSIPISADYTNNNNNIVGVISGHIHYDFSVVSESGIPVITTVCDRGPIASSPTEFTQARQFGTINEQAIDIVQIDLTNRKIYTTRIGGSYDGTGSLINPDREFTF